MMHHRYGSAQTITETPPMSLSLALPATVASRDGGNDMALNGVPAMSLPLPPLLPLSLPSLSNSNAPSTLPSNSSSVSPPVALNPQLPAPTAASAPINHHRAPGGVSSPSSQHQSRSGSAYASRFVLPRRSYSEAELPISDEKHTQSPSSRPSLPLPQPMGSSSLSHPQFHQRSAPNHNSISQPKSPMDHKQQQQQHRHQNHVSHQHEYQHHHRSTSLYSIGPSSTGRALCNPTSNSSHCSLLNNRPTLSPSPPRQAPPAPSSLPLPSSQLQAASSSSPSLFNSTNSIATGSACAVAPTCSNNMMGVTDSLYGSPYTSNGIHSDMYTLGDHAGYIPILPRTAAASALYKKRCETCATTHDGSFGAGRFCSSRCARTVGGLAHRKKRMMERDAKQRCTTGINGGVGGVGLVPDGCMSSRIGKKTRFPFHHEGSLSNDAIVQLQNEFEQQEQGRQKREEDEKQKQNHEHQVQGDDERDNGRGQEQTHGEGFVHQQQQHHSSTTTTTATTTTTTTGTGAETCADSARSPRTVMTINSLLNPTES